MEKWVLRHWVEKSGRSSIEHWLDKLTKEQLKSITKELKMLELVGYRLKLPHSKALGQGLFELREQRYGYRIYYGFCGKQIIILLAAGDKKSQRHDITIARERLLEMEK